MEQNNSNADLRPTYTAEEYRALKIIAGVFSEGVGTITHTLPDGSVKTEPFDLSQFEQTEING